MQLDLNGAALGDESGVMVLDDGCRPPSARPREWGYHGGESSRCDTTCGQSLCQLSWTDGREASAMKLRAMYESAFRSGIAADPRGPEGIERVLRHAKEEFDDLAEDKRWEFDQEASPTPTRTLGY